MAATEQSPGAGDSAAGPGEDFQYDEAHDIAGAAGAGRITHPVQMPPGTEDDGGDYGYDEAHDFGDR